MILIPSEKLVLSRFICCSVVAGVILAYCTYAESVIDSLSTKCKWSNSATIQLESFLSESSEVEKSSTGGLTIYTSLIVTPLTIDDELYPWRNPLRDPWVLARMFFTNKPSTGPTPCPESSTSTDNQVACPPLLPWRPSISMFSNVMLLAVLDPNL